MAAAQEFNDGRIHSAVFDRRDPKLNDLIHRFKKSELMTIYDVDCTMLMRVRGAYVQFDMNENHRPYLIMYGNAEGVYLEPKTGLLFPNGCDQLDFRPDYPVETQVNYDLNDIEIATLATNGLYHNDYSLQGKVIGNLLEIPCRIDYSAIANTPITYIRIHDQYAIQTNTKQSGYKTMVATFLPYDLQRHDVEEHAKVIHISKMDDKKSLIRQRDAFEMQALQFQEPVRHSKQSEGADFVKVAQDRMTERLRDSMSKGDVLGTNTGNKTAANIVDTLTMIKNQENTEKRNALLNADNDPDKVDGAGLSEKMSDMAQRVVYAGAENISVDPGKIPAEPLVDKKKPGKNDARMTSPVTDTKTADASNIIEDKSQEMHGKVFDAEETAKDIVTKLSRKDKLAQRRKNQAATRAKQLEAANQTAPAMSPEMAEKMPNTAKVERTVSKDKNDVFSEGFSGKDLDDLINSLGDE